MTESGVRVKAWAFFRELLPLIEQQLASDAHNPVMASELATLLLSGAIGHLSLFL